MENYLTTVNYCYRADFLNTVTLDKVNVYSWVNQ